jgi:plasmid stabilization system protein ParE
VKRVCCQPAALADIAEIKSHLAAKNPDGARWVVARIAGSIAMLKRLPKMGRRGAIAGTRERIVRPFGYIIVYREQAKTVEVVGVFRRASGE